MSENISALIDNEVDQEQHTNLIDELCQDSELKDRWERYHLIRSAIRGECTRAYMRSIYRPHEMQKFPVDLPVAASAYPSSIATSIKNRLQQYRSSWIGGFGLAVSLSAAVALGFFSSSLVDIQFGQAERTAFEALHNPSGPVRWVTQANLDGSTSQNVEFLNQTLLAHSESTSYPLMNGLSNYARLVVYNR